MTFDTCMEVSWDAMVVECSSYHKQIQLKLTKDCYLEGKVENLTVIHSYKWHNCYSHVCNSMVGITYIQTTKNTYSKPTI